MAFFCIALRTAAELNRLFDSELYASQGKITF